MIKVVIVEDEPAIGRAVAKLLKMISTDFLVAGIAGSGREGLKLIAQCEPQVVFIDIIMPGMDGLETAQALLEEYKDASIIMVSSLAYDDTFEEAKAIGAKGFIDKPFEKEQLLDAFAKALS